jgi:excinuclease ABC subunit B
VRPVSDITRSVAPFQVISDFTPSGDQPAAIADLATRVKRGDKDSVLLGATGRASRRRPPGWSSRCSAPPS